MSFGRPNMLSKMFLIPFLCIMSSGLLSAAIMPCKTNGDCPSNHYCYTMTNVCAECVPNFCSRIHRMDSTWKKCHTEPRDCGSCLPGYEEEYFSDGTTRASCILSHQPTPSHYSAAYVNSSGGFSPAYIPGFLGFSVVFLLGFLMYKRARSGTVRNIQTEEHELRPINNPCINESLNNSHVYEPSAPILPAYSIADPLTTCGADLYENARNTEEFCGYKAEVKGHLDCREYQFEETRRENSQLVESAIFRRPDYEEETVDNTANAQDNEEDDEDPENPEAEEDTNRVNFLMSPVQYHDESTLPSNWTPEPSQAEIENTNLPTNPGTTKRPSTEIGSSESEDERSVPKRACNNASEDDEAPTSVPIRNFRLTFTRSNQNTNANNTQNKNSEGPTKDK